MSPRNSLDIDDEYMAARPELALATPSVRAVPAWEVHAKRVLDVIVAIVCVIIFSPVFAVIAVSIKLTSPGPVLFRQQRVGLGGELFVMKKFRTMRDGTHQEVLESDTLRATYHANDFKLPSDDPRITSVGRFLRKLSLDELPQFINVLTGDMSVVGIRPVEPAQLELRADSDQDIYRTMRPGLTGLWQVEGRSTVKNEERLQLDRRYAENWSVWGDIEIMFRTPGALLRVAHAH